MKNSNRTGIEFIFDDIGLSFCDYLGRYNSRQKRKDSLSVLQRLQANEESILIATFQTDFFETNYLFSADRDNFMLSEKIQSTALYILHY